MKKILFFIPFFLWSCGGGGGGSTAPEPPQLPTVTNIEVTTLEDTPTTFAFTQIAKDVNPYVLQGLMGHSNFKTTERYLKYDKNMFVDLISNDEKLITSNETFLS